MLRPIAAQIHVPDFTLVLDASFETCQSRISRKSGAARLLDELTGNSAFHAREQEFYRWLARHRSEVLFLDVNQSEPENIAERASALIRERAKATLPRIKPCSRWLPPIPRNTNHSLATSSDCASGWKPPPSLFLKSRASISLKLWLRKPGPPQPCLAALCSSMTLVWCWTLMRLFQDH
jgi:hypothetical protein